MALHNLFGELALDDTLQDILTAIGALNTNDVEALLTSIQSSVADLDANTDAIEALLGAANGFLAAIGTNTDGLEALAASSDAALSAIAANTDGLEALQAAGNADLSTIAASIQDVDLNTDGLEALVAAGNASLTAISAAVADLDSNTDGIESLVGATNTALGNIQTVLNTISTAVADLDSNTDGIETLIGATNTALGTMQATLTSIAGSVDQLEGYVDTLETLIGTTNTSLAAIQASAGSILANQTNGTHKTQVVDGAGDTLAISAGGAALAHLDLNAHMTDIGAWTPFVDSFLMIGGVVSGSSIGAALALRANTRAALVEWVNSSGIAYGTTTNPVHIAAGHPEDGAHASGDRGVFVLGVRNDTGATRTSADGDYSGISVDLAGRIRAIIDSQALPTGASTEATSLAILAAVDQLEGYTDTLESLLGTGNTTTAAMSATLTAISNAVDQLEGYTDGIEALLGTGNTNTAATNTALAGIQTTLTAISGFVDQLEGYTDNVESLLTTGNTNTAATNTALAGIQTTLTAISGFVDQLEGYTDGIETLLGTGNTNTAAIAAAVDQLEGYLDTVEALLTTGNTNTGTTATNTTAIAAAVDQLEGYLDTVEALLTTGNTNTSNIHLAVDTLETLIGTTNTTLGNILTRQSDGTAKTQVVDGTGQVLDIQNVGAAVGSAMVQLGGGAQIADASSWTAIASHFVMVGGLVAGGVIGGAASIRAFSRAWLVELVDQSGVQMGTPTNPISVRGSKVEDSPHVSGDTGLLMFGVRNDSSAVRTDADGDYSAMSVDSTGRVKILDEGALPATTFVPGQLAPAAGVATQFPASAARRVLVKSHRNNTALGYIGVSNAVTSLTGFELASGEAIVLAVDNLSDLWLITATAGQRYSYVVLP